MGRSVGPAWSRSVGLFFVSGSSTSSGGDPGGRPPVCLCVDWPVAVWSCVGASRSPGSSPDCLPPLPPLPPGARRQTGACSSRPRNTNQRNMFGRWSRAQPLCSPIHHLIISGYLSNNKLHIDAFMYIKVQSSKFSLLSIFQCWYTENPKYVCLFCPT